MIEGPSTGLVDLTSGEWVQEWGRIQQQPPDAVPTPLNAWNRRCGGGGGKKGVAHGWFVTIAGNPGHGKSLLALNLAAKAVADGESIGFVSLEMSPESLATRLYAIAHNRQVRQYERGDEFEPRTIQAASAWAAGLKFNGVRFMLNEEPLHELYRILEVMEQMRELGCRTIIIDYLQLVDVGDDEAIYRAVARIATSMRLFAHRNAVTVFGLSQFNRGTSANYDETPSPQGMHGGMALEANSDQVVLIDHSRYKRDTMHSHIARTWLMLAKNRHGPVAGIPIEWDYRTLRLREADPHEEHLWDNLRG